MHPDELEEIEYQINARADYLSEAFGDEARILARQAEQDEIEYRRLDEEQALAFIGPQLPVQYAESIGPDLAEAMPF